MRKLLKPWVIRLASQLIRDNGPKVFYYHDIGTTYTKMGTRVELFRLHVEIVKSEGFAFVPFTAEMTGDRTVRLCFDDGFRGIWDLREYLVEQNLHPTVFIAVDLVGQPGYLNWDEVHALQDLGFTFQAHGWTHRPLTEVGESELEHEICDTRSALTEKLGKPVDMLCFPCGYFSRRVLEVAKKAGYEALVTSLPSIPSDIGTTDCTLVPRCLVQAATPLELKGILHGGMNFMTRRYFAQHWRDAR